MKLLFDQNLSFKLCALLEKHFPQSGQVRLLGLAEADDRDIWNFAKQNGYAIVTQDVDFAEMAALYGPPPKIVWLRSGNQPTAAVADRLSSQAQIIHDFFADDTACLELY